MVLASKYHPAPHHNLLTPSYLHIYVIKLNDLSGVCCDIDRVLDNINALIPAATPTTQYGTLLSLLRSSVDISFGSVALYNSYSYQYKF